MSFYAAATKKSAPLVMQSTSSATQPLVNVLGRTFSTIQQLTKATSIKVKDAVIRFFKNIPNQLQTGTGAGIFGTVVSLSGLIATQLALENNRRARIIVTIFFSTVLFASAAIMFTFGKNPIVSQ